MSAEVVAQATDIFLRIIFLEVLKGLVWGTIFGVVFLLVHKLKD